MITNHTPVVCWEFFPARLGMAALPLTRLKYSRTAV